MKLGRFLHPSSAGPRFGVIADEKVYPVTADEYFNPSEALRSQAVLALHEVRLVAPLTPSKVVCVGRNYREHAEELGNKMPEEPLLFLKAPSAVIGNDEVIELPPQSDQVEHEGELGVVMGRRARRLRPDEDPLDFVLGYTCVNDVTARDLQRKDVQFTRGKSFDTFCPVGPVIVTDLNPLNATVITRLNGDIRQQGRTSDMAFPVPFLIKYIADIMTLYPGDLIATGTPAGVSRMKPGDIVEVEVSGVGVLRNQVQSR
ncbi:MAG: fumarylacetoacetate hydrolase family protein [Acidobacteriota bacterium]|nr:fumarylacetoacetate hydrolase family protein [Acidobacteriota bacterium]